MYTLKQPPRHVDDLCLRREDGSEEILHVDFHITPQAIREYRQAQEELRHMQKDGSPADERYEKMGACINRIFAVIFGAENTRKLVDFYGGDYANMLQEVLPYLTEEVVPKFRQAAQDRKKALKRRLGS